MKVIFKNENKFKNSYGIYKIVHIPSQKIYVGQTKTMFKKRYWHHCWKLRNNSHDNKHLQSTWNKFSEKDFYFEVLYEANKEDILNDKEIEYIDFLKSYVDGFNMTIGGEGKKSCPMSERAKLIVGEKNKKHNLGKKHSESTKKKMKESSPRRKLTEKQTLALRESRIGSKHTEETKEKMKNKKIGSNNKVSKLDEVKVTEIKKLIMQGEAMTNIGKDFGVDRMTITAIRDNKTWIHVEVEGWKFFKK